MIVQLPAPLPGRELGPGELLPVRMLNEFTYCPRLGYLEWVQGEWAESADTLDGEFTHRNVDREDQRPISTTDPAADTKLHSRSLRLENAELGLVAVIDIVELDGKLATPIDYKRGKMPDVPGNAWEPEKIQLCAQGLLLQAAGFDCKEGYIYYASSKRRVVVAFDDELITRTKELAAEFRQVAAAGAIPPPLIDSPKCPRCSLVAICLPDETTALSQPANADLRAPVRMLLTPRDDAKPMYVVDHAARVGKSKDRLVVESKDTKLAEAKIIDVSQVCLFGNAHITAPALAELLDRGIPVLWFSTGGWFRGVATGLCHKNVELRIQQYSAASNQTLALALARAFISNKIKNQRTLLRRNLPTEDNRTVSLLQEMARAAERCDAIDQLLGIEGNAARLYFEGFGSLLKVATGFSFDGRNRRPPTDPVNAMMSFLYGLLAKDLHVASQAAGLDPMLGFLHQPRYGRPSLALDLAEEFRPILADSVVLSLVNTGEIQVTDFVARAGAVALTPAGRRKILGAWERRLESEVTHPLFGYTVSYRRVLSIQARLLGRVLLGEIPEYPAFRTR